MTIQIGDMKLYTLEEVSELVKVTTTTLRAYIRERRLKAQKMGGIWYVAEANLKEYFLSGETPIKPRPPRKKAGA